MRLTVLRDAHNTLFRAILYFHSPSALKPTAWIQFARFTTVLNEAIAKMQAASVVVDSLTMMELSARLLDKYITNYGSKDPRKHWAASTEALEEVLMISLAGVPCALGVAAHVSQDKDEVLGNIVYNPGAPGRLQTKLAAAFRELYHARVVRQDGNPYYFLLTHTDERFAAGTAFALPDLVANDFKFLERLAGPSISTAHFLVYGEPQSGKSTFLATLPKPQLVLFFDHFGKDHPYLSDGKALRQETFDIENALEALSVLEAGKEVMPAEK
jgi:hypothetical protein